MRYEHTQTGPLWLLALAAAAVGVVFLTRGVPAGLLLGVVLLVFVGVTFGRLTVTVDAGTLECRFGPLRRRFDLDEITGAESVRNKWWYGWGIRWTPRGWMWNCAGLDAVVIERANGRSFVIGTDEPGALLRAIRRAARLDGSTPTLP